MFLMIKSHLCEKFKEFNDEETKFLPRRGLTMEFIKMNLKSLEKRN